MQQLTIVLPSSVLGNPLQFSNVAPQPLPGSSMGLDQQFSGMALRQPPLGCSLGHQQQVGSMLPPLPPPGTSLGQQQQPIFTGVGSSVGSLSKDAADRHAAWRRKRAEERALAPAAAAPPAKRRGGVNTPMMCSTCQLPIKGAAEGKPGTCICRQQQRRQQQERERAQQRQRQRQQVG